MKAMASSWASLNNKVPHYSSKLIFEPAGMQLLNNLTVALGDSGFSVASDEIKEENQISQEDAVLDLELRPSIAEYMICNCCQAHFVDREEQIGHYKCDWHRYNLHRKLKGLPCVSEEKFEEIAGDVSSISGSDDESNDDDEVRDIERSESNISVTNSPSTKEKSSLTKHKFHKVFMKTKEGEVISLLRCLLYHKKSPLNEQESILTAASELSEKRKWIILMVAAGHFAGTVFNGNEVVDHKTFHRYTVRAKRGTAQSAADSHGTAKSAGSSLRRYNEAALIQEVQDLLSKWEEHTQTCHLVFMRVPVANRSMFYGGKKPAFKKDDSRIRVIPFNTRRPTFNETKRIHQILASVECYGKADDLKDLLQQPSTIKSDGEAAQPALRFNSPGPKHNRAGKKKQQTKQQDVSETVKNLDETVDSPDEEVDMYLVETLGVIDFSELKQFDSTVKKRPKKKKPPSNGKQNKKEDINLDKELTEIRNALFTACKTGCLDSLQTCLDNIGNETSNKSSFKDTSPNDTIMHNSKNSEASNCAHETGSNQKFCGDVSSTESDCIQQTKDKDESLLYQKSNETSVANTESDKLSPNTISIADLLSMPLRDDGSTSLHIAAKEGHSEVVTKLLISGADPSIKNKEGKTPYNLAESGVRNAFRRFMAKYPDRYDYGKAQIPSPLTEEMEAEQKRKAAEKKKAKKKAMNEQRKDKRAAEEKTRQENHDRDRFLALSDREKRALAAEKRILQQYNSQGLSQPVLSRCFQCGADITGKVPFEYSEYKFCTTKCLREHRSKSSTSK